MAKWVLNSPEHAPVPKPTDLTEVIQKVIFLDIDGPMIPAASYLYLENPSIDQILDPRCTYILKKIIEESGAKIVFNTTHNTALNKTPYSPGLRNQFFEKGFLVTNFHENDHTIYPDVDRLTAIHNWLVDNGPANWIAFDDVSLASDRAYTTDFDTGIGIGEYNHAAEYFDFTKARFIL